MPPKASGSGKAAGKGAAPPPEPDPAAALPADLPAECPFDYAWSPAVCMLAVMEGLPPITALREALRALGAPALLSVSELAARVDAADPLAAELAAATAAAAASAGAATDGCDVDGCCGGILPLPLVSRMLWQRFRRDEGLAWRFELVRRRQALARATAQAKSMQTAAILAAEAVANAEAQLAAVEGKLQLQCRGAREGEASAHTDAASAVLAQEWGEAHEPTSQQRRMLADAKASAHSAREHAAAADAALATAESELAAAEACLGAPYQVHEPYLLDVEGLPPSGKGLAAAVEHAGVPLRGVLWLHAAGTAGAAGEQAGCGTAPAPKPQLPGELARLQELALAAAWDSPLARVAVLPVPVGDVASPFTCVPRGGAVADPPWAAAAGVSATSMRFDAAVEVTPAGAGAVSSAPAASGVTAAAGKPVTAGAVIGGAAPATGKTPAAAPPPARGSGSSAKPCVGATNGAAVAVGSAPTNACSLAAGGAAAAPEDVVGVRELSRAVLTLRNAAASYERWRAHVKLDCMPPPPPPLAAVLRCGGEATAVVDAEAASAMLAAAAPRYAHALDGVPLERCGVALLLHALLEQVCHDAGAQDPCEQSCGPADGEDATLSAELDSLLLGALLNDETPLLAPKADETPAITLVCEADDLGIAACGLFSGFPHAVATDTQGVSAPNGCRHLAVPSAAAHAAGLERWHTAERCMTLLSCWPLPLSAGQAHADTLAVEGQLWKDELRACCSEGLAPETALRYQLQNSVADLLPAGVREAHGAEIRTRCHVTPFDPHTLRQAAAAAIAALPHSCHALLAPSGASVLCCFSGPATEPPGRVYELDAAVAARAARWVEKLAYTQRGAIASRGSAGALALRDGGAGGALLRLKRACKDASTSGNGASASEVLLTLRGGLLATVTSNSPAAKMLQQPDAGGCGQLTGGVPSSCGVVGSAADAVATVSQTDCPAAAAAEACGEAADAAEQSVTLRCVLPHGLMVELNSSGRVLLAPVAPPCAQSLDASGVSVLGAPLQSGHLEAAGRVGPFAWHALLPDGTLIKRALPPPRPVGGNHEVTNGQDGGGANTTTSIGAGCNSRGICWEQIGGLHILHPDGSSSDATVCNMDVASCGSVLAAPGWLHARANGERLWLLAAGTAQGLCEQAAAAAEAAAAAAAAQAADAAAAAAEAAVLAAAAEAPTRRQGAKPTSAAVDRARATERPRSATKAAATIRAPEHGVAAAGDAAHPAHACAVAAELPPTATSPGALLQRLRSLSVQPRPDLRCSSVVDADSGALVSTREDGMLVVAYADGSQLLQDAEGCRLSFTDGGWLFEGPGLPKTQRDGTGLHVSLPFGVTMTWCASTRRVRLEQPSSGARLLATPQGVVAFASNASAAAPEALTALADGMAAGSRVRGEHMESTAGSNVRNESGLVSCPRALPSLADACAAPPCWGVLGIDLESCEAALHEANGCRLHLLPGGEACVWRNDHVEQAAAAAGAAAAELAAVQAHVELARQHAAATAAAAEEAAATAAAVAAAAAATLGAVVGPSTAPAQQRAVLTETAALPAAAAAPAAPGPAAPDAPAAPMTWPPLQRDPLNEVDEEERAALNAAAAEAAAATAAEQLRGAEAALAAMAAAVMVAAPPAVASGVPPRVFVALPPSGCPDGAAGYELLPAGAAAALEDACSATAAAAGARYGASRSLLAGGEPGATCLTQLVTHDARGHEPAPLPLMQVAAVVPAPLDPLACLTCLRRTDRPSLLPPRAPCGALELPRAAARALGRPLLDCGSSFATRLPQAPSAAAGAGKVVVVQRMLQLPCLTADLQAAATAAIGAAARRTQERLARHQAYAPPADTHSPLELDNASDVAVLLASTAPLAAQLGDAHSMAMASRAGALREPAPDAALPAPLAGVRAVLVAERAAGADAALTCMTHAGATAAASTREQRCERRTWVRKPGPPHRTPQRLTPGQPLRYFHAEEGLQALQRDPGLAAAAAPGSCGSGSGGNSGSGGGRPGADAQRAHPASSAGAQLVRGVYLSAHTTLLPPADDGAEAACAADGGGGGNAAAARAPAPALGAPGAGGRERGDRAALPLPHGRTAGAASAAAAGSPADGSTGGGGSRGDSSTTIGRSLPNDEYLGREGAALRTAKTSSASLLRLQGRSDGQLIAAPARVCFGRVPVGAAARRSVRLLNASCDVARFSVSRPAPPLSVLHRPGPLAPGMVAKLELQVVGESPGCYEREVIVCTERAVLRLPVTATVVPRPEPVAAQQQQLLASPLDTEAAAT